MSAKPWGGRFTRPVDKFIEEFGASLPFDRRMWAEDIKGSIAHARMLAKQGVITSSEAEQIEGGLSGIYRDIRDGKFTFSIADEDIHMAVERALIDRIGPAGGKLHTARSRNDQVALDMRMAAKKEAARLAEAVNGLRSAMLDVSERWFGVIVPGYTHLQKAQPVLLSHHMLAYSWMLSRDLTRLRHAYEAADVMPLGSAALAGTSYPIDRDSVATALGFSATTENSMDSVSDRDFVVDLAYACALAMIHLSRLCEELVLWSADEFGFIKLDDAHSTGSSIMPQKKNPDFAELVRGKSGRVLGDLVSLLTMLKGLPLAYNKDLQEDKEALFDAVDTLADCVRAVGGMLSGMTVDTSRADEAAAGGFMAATDLADYLVGKGLPFREAHEIVGKLVLLAEESGRTLSDLTVGELKAASGRFGDDALEMLDISKVVARRTSAGGTGHDRVREQTVQARKALEADAAWVASLELD